MPSDTLAEYCLEPANEERKKRFPRLSPNLRSASGICFELFGTKLRIDVGASGGGSEESEFSAVG